MAFRFTSGAYHWSRTWTAEQKKLVLDALKVSTQYGVKPQATLDYLHKKGIKFRKTYMLENIGRAAAIEQSKTVGAAKRAEQWFNWTEKYLEMNPGMHRDKASKFMDTWKKESWKTVKEAENAKALEVEGGCPSPPCPGYKGEIELI